ncbi:glutamate--cysteine ligase [Marinifaba aquimaris]|uniref:glutamate--cysteine ligase n=1 Tax=Marinifaba aquimaris TaxID=2741323 RepID=UPI001C2D786E|nr:glutamate--cysteine ligase [Marinifaba aquimaris]
MNTRLQEHIEFLSQQDASFFKGFQRGIEREALRIEQNAHLGQGTHPQSLGKALTHQYITTDYSESLLEFITPVESDLNVSLSQLQDIHKYTLDNIGEQWLWPMSMPCFVGGEDDIQIAQYGNSNIGKMKTLYRKGLKHRYGSMMQIIAGVHFNFSFPDAFWQNWSDINNVEHSQDAISAGYLATIRNLKRHLWVLPYLFGASPALCKSFIDGKGSNYPFSQLGKGTLYLPHATSLRLSDLGYTNSEQGDLNIQYNDLSDYIQSLRNAINLPSEAFSHIGVKVDGDYRQLNDNVLQIENEFYSPIRPKRVTASGETPTQALARKGIQYMEVRALDIDPFSPVGVNEKQLRFIDLLLVWCAANDSPAIDLNEQTVLDSNMQKVILTGRKPGLMLEKSGTPISLQEWGEQLCQELIALAQIFDRNVANSPYMDAVNHALAKFSDSELTPSARLLSMMKEQNMDSVELGLQLAAHYRQVADNQAYSVFDEHVLATEASASADRQVAVEQSDNVDFDQFLADYFQRAQNQ